MALLDLFPQPRHLTELGPTIDLAGRPVRLLHPDGAPALVSRGVELVEQGQARQEERLARAPYQVEIRLDATDPAWPADAGKDESYVLELNEESGHLLAAGPAGAFHGCQTLRQLLRNQPETIPALRITDWPDLRYRGLYIESKWGSDLMTLEDWKSAIDAMAALKFNSLGIGVYGCWVVQYGGKRTEFLMLPFPDHPGLETPKTLRYYSPAAGDWQTLEYLPRMVTEDSFGKIVAYARQQNITVRPHFNSPGHNTLIPSVYPEISAKDEDGTPLRYGFCLSNPRTYDLLFELYDSVIERYLRPNGIDWFHIGLDEVQAYVGVDENDPFRSVDPWCRCPECRHKPHGRQLQEYAVRVCEHLKQQGIAHITMWNDALDKLDALDETFVAMLDAKGLRDNVVIQWWRYHEPVLIPRQELGLRAWATPMAGYWPNLFTQSYTSNISTMLLHGFRAGAEGADAYCLYDRAFDRNYLCLAQYAWNQTASEDLYQFKSRYARSVLTPMLDPALAVEAFDQYDQVFDATPWTETHLASLLYYWHTYPARRRRGTYPRDTLLEIAASHMRVRDGFNRAAGSARAARNLFAEAANQAGDPLLDEYRAECDKMVGVWESFALVLDAIGQYEGAAESDAHDAAATVSGAASLVQRARERFVTVMADLERVKAPYLVPQILRDLSITLLYIERLGEELTSVASRLEAGTLASPPSFPDLEVNQEDLDPFVSTDAVPVALAVS